MRRSGTNGKMKVFEKKWSFPEFPISLKELLKHARVVNLYIIL